MAGYRVELPEERLTAKFTDDSTLELPPDLVGPTISRNAGIPRRGRGHRLLYTKWRDAGEAPKLDLFGQLKRIPREWLEIHLQCRGGTYPAQLMYQELADIASRRRKPR